MILKERQENILPPQYVFVTLPDTVHVGKSLKSSFANWYIILEKERANLSIIHSLRESHSELQKILPRESIPHKDRMDYS